MSCHGQVCHADGCTQTELVGLGIEAKLINRPIPLCQLETHILEGDALPFCHLVVDQGVVHVEADGADGPHVQRAVAVDSPSRCRKARRLVR